MTTLPQPKEGARPYDVIVVGGGMAGLTASAFAAREGCSVLLCEQGSVLGGLIHSFERNGFTWDAGIRALEDSGIILPMLESLGISLDFVKSPVSLGIEDQVLAVESAEDLEDYRALLERLYPDRGADIARIIAAVRRVMRQMDVLYGIENPTFKNLREDRDYVFKRLLPWLGKFLVTIGRINRMSTPVDEYLESLTDSQALIDIISQHFFKKTPAFFALSYFSLYLDYMYPVGGTGTVPRAIEAYCREKGVEIKTDKRIVAVDAVGRTVTDAGGREHAYRTLIWAADLKALYQAVDLDALPKASVRQRALARADVVNVAFGGDSVFTLYLAVDIDPAWFSAISNGHFFYTASRRGVGADVHSELKAILEETGSDASEFRRQAEAWIRRYMGSTTFEISIPVLKDASLAPPGKTGLIISVLFDHALCQAARVHGWYEELKTCAEDALIDVLDATVYPSLRDVIIDRFSSTPLTIAEVVGSSDGAITGWAFTSPVMPAVHRMQHVARSVRTALPHIYQAGQWSYSPSGLPIAILTGKLAADAVCRAVR